MRCTGGVRRKDEGEVKDEEDQGPSSSLYFTAEGSFRILRRRKRMRMGLNFCRE